jgi:hypothetical protein
MCKKTQFIHIVLDKYIYKEDTLSTGLHIKYVPVLSYPSNSAMDSQAGRDTQLQHLVFNSQKSLRKYTPLIQKIISTKPRSLLKN